MKALKWSIPALGVAMTVLAAVVFFKLRVRLTGLAQVSAACFVVLTPLLAVAACKKKDCNIIALLGYILQLLALDILRNVMR
jgi:ABC-type transporter Mla MlaB component